MLKWINKLSAPHKLHLINCRTRIRIGIRITRINVEEFSKIGFVVESVANGFTASLGYSDRSARPDGFAGVPSAAAACAELFPQFGTRPQYRTVLSELEHQDDVRAQLQEEVSYSLACRYQWLGVASGKR